MRFLRLSLIAILCASSLVQARADTGDALRFFEEEAKITTASRRPQSIQEAPAAVDVITAEDIKASGAFNLWDLLRFRPGMNVIDGHPGITANRAVVSVRGFTESFARNLLVLLDGRKTYTDTGGVDWAQLPVNIQDIERIEIIRGPNAALYGSGAGLGVINIITKKPSGSETATLDGRGGNRDTFQTYEAVDSSLKTFDYRLSHSYIHQGNFDNVAEGEIADDFFHSNKGNFSSHWNLNENSQFELFAGGTWNDTGLEDGANSHNQFNQHFEMLKFSEKLGRNSHVEVTSSHNDFTSGISNDIPVSHSRTYQYDEQILHQIDWGHGRMKSTYGIDYELAKVNSQTDYPGPGVKSWLYRGYVNQTAQITQHLLSVGAFSWETRDNGKSDPNYQLSQLWEAIKNHTFRLSYSVAHTVPTASLLDRHQAATLTSPPVYGNPDLRPQALTSYEMGYRGGLLDQHLLVDADLFYTVVKDKDESFFSDTPVLNLTFANLNRAIARGAEMEMKYRFSLTRSLFVNYTYEHITDTFGNTGEVTDNTPSHAVNLGGMADLGHGFSGSFNLGYKNSYFIAFQADSLAAHAYCRLDARLAYVLPRYKNAELYVAGQNLTAPTHQEYADGLAIPRTYQAGMNVKFGCPI